MIGHDQSTPEAWSPGPRAVESKWRTAGSSHSFEPVHAAFRSRSKTRLYLGALLRNRTTELLLTMSIPGRGSTAAMLVRAGFLAARLLLDVCGFPARSGTRLARRNARLPIVPVILSGRRVSGGRSVATRKDRAERRFEHRDGLPR